MESKPSLSQIISLFGAILLVCTYLYCLWDIESPLIFGRRRENISQSIIEETPHTDRKLWGFLKDIVHKPEEKKLSAAQLERPILNDFSKNIEDWIDLNDTKPGHAWIPISMEKFDKHTTDPVIKVCQVNYAGYAKEPWKHPMGNLLNVFSGCEQLMGSDIKLLRYSTLQKVIEEEQSRILYPSGFIYHETRCGSTLVANMIATMDSTIMWSESTGPWKVLNTCKDCEAEQLIEYMRFTMFLMGRPGPDDIGKRTRLFFKLQSSDSINIISQAFPDVPWIYLFREPVEVIMSRMGAQRLGMEGAHDEIAQKLVGFAGKNRKDIQQSPEMRNAKTLASFCQKAIKAYRDRPGTGMMIEYVHLPDIVWKYVLPVHFKVNLTEDDELKLTKATAIYSKAVENDKSKFSDDKAEKHSAASEAVKTAAATVLEPIYRQLQDMQGWLREIKQ